MRVKGKRGLAVCMAALLALSGMKVSAAEAVQMEEMVAEAAATVSGSDVEVGICQGGIGVLIMHEDLIAVKLHQQRLM